MIVSELVTRALRLAGIAGVGKAPSADEMDQGVTTLNEMLFSWALDGLDLGHQTVTHADELYLDDAHLKGIRYSLAVELAAETGTDLPAAIIQIALMEQAAIRATLYEVDTLRCDEAVLHRNAVDDINDV